MTAIRRVLARLGAGDRRYAVPALVLACCMLLGYVGTTAHAVEHFSDGQPEAICHLCLAGDQYTPIPLRPTAGIVRVTVEKPVPRLDIAPPAVRLPILHGVRAPPLTA